MPTGIAFVKCTFLSAIARNATFTHWLLELFNCANKLADENSTNLTNIAHWLVFSLERAAGAASRRDPCARYSHVQRTQSFLSLPLSSDVLIHPVPSTQTLHHTAFFYYHLRVLLDLSHLPSLSSYCLCLYASFTYTQTYTHKLTPPANPRPLEADIVCHPWATWGHRQLSSLPLMCIWENVCHFEAW